MVGVIIEQSCKKFNILHIQKVLFGGKKFAHNNFIYRVSQKEMSVFWEDIVLVILSKTVYKYMFPACCFTVQLQNC